MIHPTSLTNGALIGEGTRIWAFVNIMAGAVVGADCNIGDHCFIEEGAVLGDGVIVKNGVSIWNGVHIGHRAFIGPNAVFTNDLRPRAGMRREIVPTWVEDGASIGANATIVCGITVGRHALVAAAAVVTRDVPAHALVTGAPATVRAFVCICGATLATSSPIVCGECGRRYQRVGAAVAVVP